MLCISGMTFELAQMSLFLRPWVGFVVDLGQVLEVEVGVDLRG